MLKSSQSVQVGGVVVLYYPTPDNLQAIHDWAMECAEVCIVDNSPEIPTFVQDFLQAHSQIHYLHFPTNIGIAAALNRGINELNSPVITHILTMDQDSRPEIGMIKQLIEFLENYSHPEQIAVLSPIHLLKDDINPVLQNQPFESKEWLMTSGNLVHKQIWQRLGGFDEGLFIDCVDEDFGRKVCLHGLLNIQVNSIPMYHELGYRTTHRLCGFTFFPTHYSPFRRYFITRNRLYMLKRYTKFRSSEVIKYLTQFRKDLQNILLFEKQKVTKIRMILLGIYHFCTNRYGKP